MRALRLRIAPCNEGIAHYNTDGGQQQQQATTTNNKEQQQRTTTRHNQSWPCCCQSISNRQRRIFACQSQGEPSPVWTLQTAAGSTSRQQAAAAVGITRHLTILPRRVITTGHAECRRLIDRWLDRALIMIRYDRKFMYCACVDCQLFRHNYSNG